MDHLGTLNDTTPRIRIGPDQPITPDIIFGLDTRLFSKTSEEGIDWERLAGGKGLEGHTDEVEVRSVRRGGKGKAIHVHQEGENCFTCPPETGNIKLSMEEDEVVPIERAQLDSELSKLGFEIYRGEYTFALNCRAGLMVISERCCKASLYDSAI
jgi:hypothetical protein